MASSSGDLLERMGPAELIGLVRDLLGEVGRLRAANEALQGEVARLKSENQTLKDEIARLKHLPPRPPLKPSGMEGERRRRIGHCWRKRGAADKNCPLLQLPLRPAPQSEPAVR